MPQNILNTGGRYDPSTNSWTATSTDQRAIWPGVSHGSMDRQRNDRLGWKNAADFNTGGRYNPDTDSWTATSTTNAPSARDLHTAVWTGSEMIVWGGEDRISVLNTGGRYCAQSGPTPTATPTSTATRHPLLSTPTRLQRDSTYSYT